MNSANVWIQCLKCPGVGVANTTVDPFCQEAWHDKIIGSQNVSNHCYLYCILKEQGLNPHVHLNLLALELK